MPNMSTETCLATTKGTDIECNEKIIIIVCLCACPLQLFVIAYDDGEPVKFNSTLVEITVAQPSLIPVFKPDEYM